MMKRRNMLKMLAGGAMLAKAADVKRVLVMFKCHFDAGFIDTQYNVVHKYFNQYFPHAIEVAREANPGGKRRYVWTTGSWLLFEYLEQASPADRKTMEDALAKANELVDEGYSAVTIQDENGYLYLQADFSLLGQKPTTEQ